MRVRLMSVAAIFLANAFPRKPAEEFMASAARCARDRTAPAA
jgi:hypothetical protein